MELHVGTTLLDRVVSTIVSQDEDVGKVWASWLSLRLTMVCLPPTAQIQVLSSTLTVPLANLPHHDRVVLARVALTNQDPSLWEDEFYRYVLPILIEYKVVPPHAQ